MLVTLRRRDGEWQLAQRDGWRADDERIARYLMLLAQARRVEAKTDRPVMYPRLGVEDVADAQAGGTELRLSGREIAATLLIGKPHKPSGGRYVRLGGQARSWKTDADVLFDPDPVSWLDRRVLAVPLARAGICTGTFYVSAVTGSTGAGRTPRDTTHHPFRHANLFAYQALKHRHDPEVRALTREATGIDVRLRFVPQSGPFARGIHATIFAEKGAGYGAADVHAALADFYRNAAFVRVESEPPRMKDIAGSNYAALHASVAGDTVVVCSVLDNLLKGAAGGSLQWINRLLKFPETMGLEAPAAG